jgi:hypothetical protein
MHFDDLRDLGSFPKTKLASVVCSSQTITAGHKLRIRFIDKLKARLGDDVDIYGRGFNPIADKWDAIAPYKYHIVLENSRLNTGVKNSGCLRHAFPIHMVHSI